MTRAPIAFFCYKRLWHTQQTIESLLRNSLSSESDLIVFCDGARGPGDVKDVESVRAYVKTIKGFRSLRIIEREQNMGLSRSIISGVTSVSEEFGKVIVVEDDLSVSPGFLTFLNDALDRYQNDSRVISISAYVYPISDLPEPTFFLRGADCWGWATWADKWALFEPDGERLLNEILRSGRRKEFDIGGSFPFFKMLEDQVAGRVDSWAIRFNATAFVRDKLTLYPYRTLVRNIGLDGSGEHCDSDVFGFTELAQNIEVPSQIPEHSARAAKAFEKYFESIRSGGLRGVFNRILRLLRGPRK